MNLETRIARLEKVATARRDDDPRDGVTTLVMMFLTIGGLRPDDPADTIAGRYAERLNEMGLDPEPDDETRIAHIRAWYLRGVASAGWRPDTP